MKKIKLNNEKFVTVDDDDFESLSKHNWQFCLSHGEKGYARRKITVNSKRVLIIMHRVITNCPSGMEVDHINGDTLDNRKQNLRICTRQENAQNIGRHKDSGNLHLGVYWNKLERKWKAGITSDYKHIHLGTFSTMEEAMAARKIAEKKIKGSFRRES